MVHLTLTFIRITIASLILKTFLNCFRGKGYFRYNQVSNELINDIELVSHFYAKLFLIKHILSWFNFKLRELILISIKFSLFHFYV